MNFNELIEEYKDEVNEITVTQVNNLLNSVSNDSAPTKLLLIDVREDHEWQLGHIDNAIHLSKGVIERDIAKVVTDRNTLIILYCAGGMRSILAAYNLQKMGYNNVKSMIGGYRAWQIMH